MDRLTFIKTTVLSGIGFSLMPMPSLFAAPAEVTSGMRMLALPAALNHIRHGNDALSLATSGFAPEGWLLDFRKDVFHKNGFGPRAGRHGTHGNPGQGSQR